MEQTPATTPRWPCVLGIKPGYPAKKALDQYRKLGNAGVVRAIGLLAQADLDLRGAKEWPERAGLWKCSSAPAQSVGHHSPPVKSRPSQVHARLRRLEH